MVHMRGQIFYKFFQKPFTQLREYSKQMNILTIFN